MQSQFTITEYLNSVKGAISSNTLDVVLSVNPSAVTSSFIPKLQIFLQPLSDKDIMKQIENTHFFNNDWISFENLVQRYLIFVRDFNPWSLLESIDLLISFYESLGIALNNPQFSSMLLTLVVKSTKLLIPLSQLVDEKLMIMNNRTNDYPRLSYLSTLLLKVLNNLRNDQELNTPANKYKISVLMYISISLCNTYVKIGSPMLCNNVFSNINILSLNKNLISRKQLVQYRFVLGRFNMQQSHFYTAYIHFNWCFANCHYNTSPQMIATICKYLIPCGLVVGQILYQWRPVPFYRSC
ncbi:unnamed protein product [Ambrosiozyma monospora]|uniref:Unnamed protein product n=1 Tax=Ambrosiozyma monospora TaxID=43982 RepID=A0ACB5T364_AMBMO|nr:unnamed protein product [Ambrosiozyma monospora]